MNIGFMGMGRMGSRMVTHLIIDGSNDIFIYNRTKSKLQPLLSMGAKATDSPAELADRVSLLFTMLSGPEAVEEAAIGERGFLSALKENSIWVDCSTINPEFAKKMSDAAGSVGVRYVDSPVGGSLIPAQKGELEFYVGASHNDFEAIRPVLEMMGKRVTHMGQTSMGVAMKMVHSLLLTGTMFLASEALILGEKTGLSRQQLLETLLQSPVSPPFLQSKRQNFESGSHHTHFALNLALNDLHQIQSTAFNADVILGATSAIKEFFACANNAGLSEKDFSSIYHFLKNPSERQ
ncbi:NAD(P)-dependent oxidoreductase [Chitinispirillales bacterium ANBcel5]|uniref:NAD(P)-dependent oxidoreductase n=1 Tax=Cellulosispirillum alkaliphilum TaxID=3039283 RepID=UPI002A55F833|nr:NAD(P)-dependent oxidoreductase [Chitinispirillales bacterium ANBcel5]